MKNALIAVAILLAGCSPRTGEAPLEQPSSIAARREIWAAIQPLSAASRIDPLFVYALVRSESDFNPRARRGDARGLMQLKPRAWESASPLPYSREVWSWRSNLQVGVSILGQLRETLERRGKFSYAVLWASYHYGLEYTAAHDYDMGRIPRPTDPISRRLWAGDTHPLAPPK